METLCQGVTQTSPMCQIDAGKEVLGSILPTVSDLPQTSMKKLLIWKYTFSTVSGICDQD